MSQTLAAVGAVLMAVLQSTIVPFLVVDGATPDLLLVYAIVLAVIIGLDHGVIAAFVGGTTLDALARFRSGGFIGTAKDKDYDEDTWMFRAKKANYY